MKVLKKFIDRPVGEVENALEHAKAHQLRLTLIGKPAYGQRSPRHYSKDARKAFPEWLRPKHTFR